MKIADKERGVPQTALELEAVQTPPEGSREGKRIVDELEIDEEGKAYSLACDVFNEAQARMNWERFDVLDSVGIGERLNA